MYGSISSNAYDYGHGYGYGYGYGGWGMGDGGWRRSDLKRVQVQLGLLWWTLDDVIFLSRKNDRKIIIKKCWVRDTFIL